MSDIDVRQARLADAKPVAAFTANTWAEFESGDYIPETFPEWVLSDGPDQRTFVAEIGGTVVGCCQVVLLSADEAWTQGMRVHPDHRGAGVGRALDEACAAWASERGATVVRNMVFSWNEMGLAASRSYGYEPRVGFRWAHLSPDPDAAVDGNISSDPDVCWSYWQRSEAHDALAGLAIDPAEPWAFSRWTRDRMATTADERAVLGVSHDKGRAVSWRTRVADADEGRRVEYGAAGWDGLDGARTLFAAIRRDAASVDADQVRVLLPETPRHIADGAAAGAELDEHSDMVLAADLTG
jgi:GNAT superfamily N-acetyltransferase